MSEYVQEAPEVYNVEEYEQIAIRARGLLSALWHESSWPEEYMPHISAGIVRIVLHAVDELELRKVQQCTVCTDLYTEQEYLEYDWMNKEKERCVKPAGHQGLHLAYNGSRGCEWKD